ncbi:DUF6438 domain-containing protein [Chryseobacterium sp. c4a]|uniref:DUF6438 domain-containing protein n=1 Tax=Chryseobacterium sp. c4a TaxID=1573582 RepID=UPI00135C0D13|nr:DUF6438 domain-containing protein [Chryseobacterium sp. c4a]
MKYIVSLIFLSFAIICSGQQKANSANTVEKVIIKKSDCMSGKCLVYTIIIHKDGKVYLEALRNIPNNLNGTYTSKLGYLDWEVITHLDFNTLNKSYGNVRYTDFSSTDLEIFYSKGKSKKVHDHFSEATPELIKLYEHIELLFIKLRWKRVKQ